MGIVLAPLQSSTPLNDVLMEEGSVLIYLYDFGDGWEHAIVLEKRLPQTEDASYPACVEGQYACPPEDCGGVSGYRDLLKILRTPGHKQYEEMREWAGQEFDPHTFSVDAVNRLLAPDPVRYRVLQ